METITFHCKIITPMFLAGADGQTPELRAPSIKGAMRFWWRAINGHLTTKNSQDKWDYSKLKRQEEEIFGGVDSGTRSKIILRVTNSNLVVGIEPFPDNYKVSTPGTNKSSNLLEYLAYGVVTRPNTIDREFFKPGGSFSITATFPGSYKEVVTDAFSLVSHFGGLGSRSRNGYGSFYIPESNSSIIDIFKKNRHGDLQLYTAFSSQARLFLGSGHHEKWEDALFEVGNAYRSARLGLEKRHEGAKRKYISQPLFIKDSSTGNNTLSLSDMHKPLERNAKCFFIGITHAENKFRGHILYLPHRMKEHEAYLKQNDLLANALTSYKLNEVL